MSQEKGLLMRHELKGIIFVHSKAGRLFPDSLECCHISLCTINGDL